MSSKEIELKAIEFAQKHYRNRGHTIREKSAKGCDLVVTKMGKEYLIEVKGRTRSWRFINVPMQKFRLHA